MEIKKKFVPFFFENYYEKIAHLTTKTSFLKCEDDEVNAIILFQNSKYKKMPGFDKKQIEILKNLEKKLDGILSEKQKENGVFIKLSFRSPKDGFPLDTLNLQKIFDEELQKLKKKWNKKNFPAEMSSLDYEGNLNWIAYGRALEICLRCKNGKEMMNLILSSDRVLEDLSEFYKENQKIDICFIIRDWIEGTNGIYEFRCFIFQNKITGITQYNHPWMIEELLNNKCCEDIKLKLYNYWKNNLFERLQELNTYVIDFGLKNDINGEVYLIELNPFEESGRGMFEGKEGLDIITGKNRDESKNDYENLVFKVRDKLDIPYGDYWFNLCKYKFDDYKMGIPYYEYFEEKK